jgi:hypothetical protein
MWLSFADGAEPAYEIDEARARDLSSALHAASLRWWTEPVVVVDEVRIGQIELLASNRPAPLLLVTLDTSPLPGDVPRVELVVKHPDDGVDIWSLVSPEVEELRALLLRAATGVTSEKATVAGTMGGDSPWLTVRSGIEGQPFIELSFDDELVRERESQLWLQMPAAEATRLRDLLADAASLLARTKPTPYTAPVTVAHFAWR